MFEIRSVAGQQTQPTPHSDIDRKGLDFNTCSQELLYFHCIFEGTIFPCQPSVGATDNASLFDFPDETKAEGQLAWLTSLALLDAITFFNAG